MRGDGKTGWIRVPILPEIRSIARDRVLGYNEPASIKTIEDVMIDCWTQGFLDGALLLRDQLEPLLTDTEVSP
jgi:hypothetical protein